MKFYTSGREGTMGLIPAEAGDDGLQTYLPISSRKNWEYTVLEVLKISKSL